MKSPEKKAPADLARENYILHELRSLPPTSADSRIFGFVVFPESVDF